jgi:hypothetical protein
MKLEMLYVLSPQPGLSNEKREPGEKYNDYTSDMTI